MRLSRYIFVGCAIIFIGLCLLHYFSSRPLWLDESFILKNIQALDYQKLQGPLQYSQAFPRTYLIAIKALAQNFDYSPFALRLLPLFSIIAAFFIWGGLFKRNLDIKWLFFLSLFAFSVSYYISYYSAELKPYSMDVLAVGVFCTYIIFQKNISHTKPSLKIIIATILLPLAILFSYGSLFVFWIVIYNYFFIVKANRKYLPLALIYTVLCGLCLYFVYMSDLRFSFKESGLSVYWQDYFVCTDSVYCFFKSFGEGTRKLVVWWFGTLPVFRKVASFFIPFFFISLFTWGSKSLLRNRGRIIDIAAVGLIVFIQLLILGSLQKYPFTGERVTLFFAPFVFFMIAKSFSAFRKIPFIYKTLGAFYLCFLFACFFNTFSLYLKLYQ